MNHTRYIYKFDSDTLTYKRVLDNAPVTKFDVHKLEYNTDDIEDFYSKVDGLSLSERIKIKKQAMSKMFLQAC